MDRVNAYLNSLEPNQRFLVIGFIYAVFLGFFISVMVMSARDSEAEPSTTASTTTTSTTIDQSVPTTLPEETTTTTTEATTTTTVVSSTTTGVPGSALVLGPTGVGNHNFGANSDQVVSAMTTQLGNPTEDTGWVPSASLGACLGDNVRMVSWGAIRLFFTDGASEWGVQGVRHFASWAYSLELGPDNFPAATPQGITLGSTVRDLVIAYGTLVQVVDDPMLGPIFTVNTPGAGFIEGELTSRQTSGIIENLYAGVSCAG